MRTCLQHQSSDDKLAEMICRAMGLHAQHPGFPLACSRSPPEFRGKYAQVGSRAERMGLRGAKHLFLYSATRLVDVLQEIVAMQPRAVIVDSIQTVYLDDVTGSAGSVSQVN